LVDALPCDWLIHRLVVDFGATAISTSSTMQSVKSISDRTWIRT
jgi:hypothetical protein